MSKRTKYILTYVWCFQLEQNHMYQVQCTAGMCSSSPMHHTNAGTLHIYVAANFPRHLPPHSGRWMHEIPSCGELFLRKTSLRRFGRYRRRSPVLSKPRTRRKQTLDKTYYIATSSSKVYFALPCVMVNPKRSLAVSAARVASAEVRCGAAVVTGSCGR